MGQILGVVAKLGRAERRPREVYAAEDAGHGVVTVCGDSLVVA